MGTVGWSRTTLVVDMRGVCMYRPSIPQTSRARKALAAVTLPLTGSAVLIAATTSPAAAAGDKNYSHTFTDTNGISQTCTVATARELPFNGDAQVGRGRTAISGTGACTGDAVHHRELARPGRRLQQPQPQHRWCFRRAEVRTGRFRIHDAAHGRLRQLHGQLRILRPPDQVRIGPVVGAGGRPDSSIRDALRPRMV